jgi:hypothetical protein
LEALTRASTVTSGEASDRDTRFADWIEAFDALAVSGPAIWAVEDVHWASGDVLAFLTAAGRAPSRHGRLIVATARPSLMQRLGDGLERLELVPLPPADAGRLIAALIGDALPPELVVEIAQRSDGNPLFIEELFRSWVATGTLERSNGGWRLTQPSVTIALPTTVQAIYAGQLDDLPAPIRDVARRASVAGRRFPAEALGALGVESPKTGVEGLLARALVNGPIADAVTGPGFAYRHALLRDAGYSSLGRADRARLHVRLARWLESVAGDERDGIADRIGGHFEAALASAPALATEVDDGLPRPAAAATAAAWLERAADRPSHSAPETPPWTCSGVAWPSRRRRMASTPRGGCFVWRPRRVHPATWVKPFASPSAARPSIATGSTAPRLAHPTMARRGTDMPAPPTHEPRWSRSSSTSSKPAPSPRPR